MSKEINRRSRFLLIVLLAAGACTVASAAHAQSPGESGEPYPNMPSVAPIGVRIARYAEIDQ